MAALSLGARALMYYGSQFPNHPRKWWVHNQLRRLLRIHIDEEMEVVREGLRWSLNPADHGHSSLFWLGNKDSWVMHQLRGLVEPGNVIIDAGANFGYFALSLATQLKGQCRVHACEPYPANHELLVLNRALNGLQECIQTHQIAFSDSPGRGEMIDVPGNAGHARVRRAEGGTIPITTLDEFCDVERLDRLDLLLLDVEGYEEQALRGAATVLSRFRPVVVVELWPPVMTLESTTPDAVADVLLQQGYHLYESVRGQLQPLTTLPSGDRGVYAFAFPGGKAPQGQN